MIDDYKVSLAESEQRIQTLLEENAKLKDQVQKLQKIVSRLNEQKRHRLSSEEADQVWVCFKIMCGLSYDDMRILRRCEAMIRGKQLNYNIPSEELIQTAHRACASRLNTIY